MVENTRAKSTLGIGKGLALITILFLAGCSGSARRAGRSTITVWEPFGGSSRRDLQAIVNQFQRTHPLIHVRLSYAANNLTSSQKLFLAIAGGVPPDVTFVDGQQMAEWAARGALADITAEVKKAGITGNEFWLPRWQESVFAGHIYALPWGADPNFALAWNKTLFRQAGLPPNRPPKTMKQLDFDIRKLTDIRPSGRIVRLGLIPWEWGNANSMFNWSYAFGGNFYQLPRAGHLLGRVTVNAPENIHGLTWMAGWARRLGISRVAGFQSNFVGTASSPFFMGRVAMTLLHIQQYFNMKKDAPTLNYGLAYIPAGPRGHYPTAWLGGFSLAIPRGNKPRPAAFTFIRWMCTSRAATMAAGRNMGQFPAFRDSPYYKSIRHNKDLMVYYHIVSRTTHARSLMPVQGYLMELLSRACDQVFYEHYTPRQALDAANAKARARLLQVMRGVARRMKAQLKAGRHE